MFDGVHCGHAQLLKTARDMAARHHACMCVHTYSNHPAQIIAPEKCPKLLTSAREKAALLEQLGVEILMMPAFTEEFSRMDEAEFIGMLVGQLNLSGVVIGYNYHFGRNGTGDAARMEEYGRRLGFEVQVVPPYEIDGATVSSTRVRNLVKIGALDGVRQLTGRTYSLCGEVIYGRQIGRTMQTPTANIAVPEEKLLPPNGVYASLLTCGQTTYPAVCNIGIRPTFDDGRGLTVEAHALDCRLDLYDQAVKLQFLKFLREEKKFKSPQELRMQIVQDAEQAREYLKKSIQFPEK